MNGRAEYLGDGLYVKDEGFQFLLYTDRMHEGRHYVGLDSHVLSAFLAFIERTRGLKITIEPRKRAEDSQHG